MRIISLLIGRIERCANYSDYSDYPELTNVSARQRATQSALLFVQMVFLRRKWSNSSMRRITALVAA
ncbi:hypothetical protein BWP39_30620 [Paraburkholderia acidicola]|uniref:Uncharacterized protein n=1 Tax=Paraburkholderia acidicola TaxID=1912599 RepID=A0A2A4EVD3_9BURK|nr:hypothetical protein BWP39_30620 [Paraburkholderia acidicola]